MQNPDSRTPDAPTPRLLRMSSIIGDVLAEATAAHDARVSGQLRGPVTSFESLDKRIGGALPDSGPCVVLGNTGSGKTALVMQIAASCGFPALVVTTEMSPAELFRRQMARVTGQFLGRFKTGEFPPEQVAEYARTTAEAMPDLAILDATRAYPNPTVLRDAALATQGDEKTVLLVVDSLQTWGRIANTGAPEYETVTSAMLAVQRVCSDIKCPALLVSEQNRGAIKEGGGTNSGAGSRFIEYGAEIIFDLQAEKDVSASGEKVVTVALEKNRHGAAGSRTTLLFNGALQRFKEESEEDSDLRRSIARSRGEDTGPKPKKERRI